MYISENISASRQPAAARKAKPNGSGPIGTKIGISGANPLKPNETAPRGGGGLDSGSATTPALATSHQPLATGADARRSRAHISLANRAPRCVHVKPNGVRCGSPALKNWPWCHFHHTYYNAPWENTFPPLEDGNGVQAALMYVLERLRMEAFRGGEVNVPIVKALLYGLQTASYNLRHTNFNPVLDPPVTSWDIHNDLPADAIADPAKKPVTRG